MIDKNGPTRGGDKRQHALQFRFRVPRTYRYKSTRNTEETYGNNNFCTTKTALPGTGRSIPAVTFALITLESYQSNKKFMKSNSILQKEEPINTLYTMNRWCCCILASMYIMLVVLPTIILSRYQNSKCETACVCVLNPSRTSGQRQWSYTLVASTPS